MECYNNIVKLKAKGIGLLNCLNYGHPKDSIENLKNFLYELNYYCSNYKIPIVGGNVSLYNATDNISIKPTPIIVMFGIRDKLK